MDKNEFEEMMEWVAIPPPACFSKPDKKVEIEQVYEGKDSHGQALYSSLKITVKGGDYVKLIGITAAEFAAIAQKVDPGVQWKSTGAPAGTGEEGFLSYKASTYSKHKLINKMGEPFNKPCGHATAAMVSAAIKHHKELNGIQVTIWAAKLKFNKYSQMSHYKHMAAKVNEGFTCKCAELGFPQYSASGAGGVTMESPLPKPVDSLGEWAKKATMEYPKPKPPKILEHLLKDPEVGVVKPVPPKPVHPDIQYDPLGGPSLPPGDAQAIPGKRRDMHAATCGVYVLEEMYVALELLERSQEGEVTRRDLDFMRRESFKGRLRVFRRAYAERLARNLFDFCVMASYGEARHRDGHYYAMGEGSAQGRSAAYLKATKYDPKYLIPLLERMFCWVSWGGTDNTGYGGPRWGNIAITAGRYYDLLENPVLFVDHCVDLVHNGGMAFNKGHIITNPSDQHEYMAMLDEKRNGSLLKWKGHNLPMAPEVMSLVIEAWGLGIIEKPLAEIVPVDEPLVPTIAWGDKKPGKMSYLTPELEKPIYWKPEKKKSKEELAAEKAEKAMAYQKLMEKKKAKLAATHTPEHYPAERKD
jgi:hypothetical protein